MMFVVGLVGVMAANGLSVDISVTSSSSPPCVPGELLVAFTDEESTVMTLTSGTYSSTISEVNDVLQRYHLSGVEPLFCDKSPMKNVFILRFPREADLEAITHELLDLPSIMAVERNLLMAVDLDFFPSNYACRHDWYCGGAHGRTDTWPFWSMQLDRAWDITRGDSTVIVAIMDSGIDYAHPYVAPLVWQNLGEDADQDGHTLEFNGSSWAFDPGDADTLDNDLNGKVNDFVGWDFIENDGDVQHGGTQNSHGTTMGSIISCVTNTDTLGSAGITWHSKLMALRAVISEQNDSTQLGWVIGATNYAAAKGADIVNMSFSTDVNSELWHVFIIQASQAGVIFVSSAGRSPVGSNGSELDTITKRYPQWWDEVICVAAVDTFGYKTNVLSNWGTTVDISGYSKSQAEFRGAGHVICMYDTNRATDCNSSNQYPGTQHPHQFWYTGLFTSGTCAEASGVLALLKSMYPTASADFLKQELYRGATPLPDPLYAQGKLGVGAINAYRSLTQWGTISQNTTWSNNVYVSGDITLTNGASLTVDPGTTVYIMPDDNEKAGYDTTRVELHVKGGFLDVNGTAEAPVRFIAWDESGETSDGDAWRFLFLWDTLDTGASFDYCTIKNAIYGIEDQVNITLNHCTIEDCAKRGLVVAYAESVYVANTTIRNIGPGNHTDAFGLNVLAGGTVRMDCSTIENVGTNAAQVLSGGKLYANFCNFFESDKGLYLWRDYGNVVDAEIKYCTIRHNDHGVWVKGPGVDDVLVEHCVIDSNTTANIYCENAASILIKYNAIKYSPIGILAYGSGPWITNANDIQHNTTGVKCDGGAEGVVVDHTRITNNQAGVAVLGESEPDLGQGPWGSTGYNNISSNSGYHVTNLSESITVMAQNNYWGTCPPKANKFYGLVDYSDSLCQAPLVSEANADIDMESPELPMNYALDYNYPNPFNPTTTIRYAVPPPGGRVVIAIFNVQGQRVLTLVDAEKSANFYSVTWDGKSARGEAVASGVYFARMTAPGFETTKKVLLLK
jgi:hypothetical protein